MVSITSPLKGKRIGVIGFNARPIACSAKKAGASVFVSDYWGDEDLSTCCDEWVAVLTPTVGTRQRQPLNMPLQAALVDNLLHLTKDSQLDLVLVGSGFDDYSEVIDPLEDMGLLVGCSPEEMERARDFQKLKKLAEQMELKFPKRDICNKPDLSKGYFPETSNILNIQGLKGRIYADSVPVLDDTSEIYRFSVH